MSKVPYQLLELSIISAQDLPPVSKNPRTYAVAWVNQARKLRTPVDPHGRTNPTWNDKFVFRVTDRFLDSDTSSAVIEIYAVGWLRDQLMGSVSVSIGDLIPPSARRGKSSRRFVALQIRRPSGRPQGILNMGVSLLDNTMRSMPLHTELSGGSSTVGFRELIQENLQKKKKYSNDDNQEKSVPEKKKKEKNIKLQRSLSDQTELTRKHGGGGGGNKKKFGGSICNGSVQYYNYGLAVNNEGGCGSAVNGGGSMVNSDVGPSPSVVAAAVAWGLYPTQQGPPPKPGSSVLEDWTVEDQASVECLKSKIERWRMEKNYDQMYKRLENSKRREKKRSHGGSHQRHRRKTADEEEGRFSCFGNAYGCEFTIVCGASKNGSGKKGRRRSRGYTSSVSEI